MPMNKLERVLWRIRKQHPAADTVTNDQLKRAIYEEIGTDPRTYKANRHAMIVLGWIRSEGRKKIRLTGRDITG